MNVVWTTCFPVWGIVLCFALGYISPLPQTAFRLNPTFNNNMPPVGSGFVPDQHSRTRIDCGTRCQEVPGCLSYFFSKATSRCQLHDQVLGENPCMFDPTARYYSIEGMPPAPLTCPNFTTGLTTMTLSDCSLFTFRVNSATAVTQPVAISDCGVVGMKLVSIETPARLHVMRFIATCPGFNTMVYWIDARSDNAENPWNPDTWLTSGGALSFFGGLLQPSSPDTRRCAALKLSAFGDVRCNSMFYTMCETMPSGGDPVL